MNDRSCTLGNVIPSELHEMNYLWKSRRVRSNSCARGNAFSLPPLRYIDSPPSKRRLCRQIASFFQMPPLPPFPSTNALPVSIPTLNGVITWLAAGTINQLITPACKISIQLACTPRVGECTIFPLRPASRVPRRSHRNRISCELLLRP